MKQAKFFKTPLAFLCALLIAATAMFITGCGGETNSTAASSEVTSKASSVASTEASSAVPEETASNVLGEGEKSFSFTITDVEGNETEYEIHTDKATVGEALLELELIAGEEGNYGLYVKTVNGITLDYDTDGKYWAFYIDGEYAMSSVDLTKIKTGSTYSFKAEH